MIIILGVIKTSTYREQARYMDYFNKGPKMYNEIPYNIKNSANLNVFKQKSIDYVKEKWPV